MEAENRTEREPNEKIDAKNDQEMRICGSTDIMKCAAPSCQTEEDNETLLCAKCKKEFHYQCTNLPAYQIFKFTQIEYSLYECEGCVVIPTHMQEMLNNRIPQNKCDRRFAEIDYLKSRPETARERNIRTQRTRDYIRDNRIKSEQKAEIRKHRRRNERCAYRRICEQRHRNSSATK